MCICQKFKEDGIMLATIFEMVEKILELSGVIDPAAGIVKDVFEMILGLFA